jgi:hypothetical protein
MVGSAIMNILQAQGYSDIVTRTHAVDDATTRHRKRLCNSHEVQYTVRQFIQWSAGGWVLPCALRVRALTKKPL